MSIIPSNPFLRTWFSSASCAPISGVVIVADIISPITVNDTVNGPNTYSLQMNVKTTDSYLIQPVLSACPGLFFCEAPNLPNQGINNQNTAYVFQDPISYDFYSQGAGFLLALIQNPSSSDMMTMLWPRKNGTLQGAPIYETFGEIHSIQSVAFDIVGQGGGNAQFSSGAFKVSVKLEGITDGTFYGSPLSDVVPTPPANLCSNGIPFQTTEGTSLVETITSSDVTSAFFELVYANYSN